MMVERNTKLSSKIRDIKCYVQHHLPQACFCLAVPLPVFLINFKQIENSLESRSKAQFRTRVVDPFQQRQLKDRFHTSGLSNTCKQFNIKRPFRNKRVPENLLCKIRPKKFRTTLSIINWNAKYNTGDCSKDTPWIMSPRFS